MQPQIIADFETQLSTAIAIGATSFSISSGLDDDGIAAPTGTYYFTVDNGSSNKEYLTGTLTGTSVTVVKSVSRQGVETTGAVRAHRVGASVIMTDFATYKKYMDAIAISGGVAATTSSLGIGRVSAVPVNAAIPIFVGDNDPRIFPNAYAADAGGTDAYAITLSIAPAAYVAGQVYAFRANTANTGTASLNVNALGARTIMKGGTTDLADSDITALMHVIVLYDGTNFQLMSRSVLPGANIQVFTTSGTWTKPTGATFVETTVIGGGGGGASGSANQTITAAAGGGGGGGGYSARTISAALLASTVSVTVGTGGAGGASRIATVNTAGLVGTVGNDSSFGTHITAKGGLGGTVSTGGVGGGGSSPSSTNGTAAGNGGGNEAAGNAGTASTMYVPTGGGGGGGGNPSTGQAGGAGGAISAVLTRAGGTAGGASAAGGAGVASTANDPTGGTGGGGGGGAPNGGTGGAGGAGGIYGGGGGGGGSATGNNTGATQTSGAGGAGAAGIVIVITS